MNEKCSYQVSYHIRAMANPISLTEDLLQYRDESQDYTITQNKSILCEKSPAYFGKLNSRQADRKAGKIKKLLQSCKIPATSDSSDCEAESQPSPPAFPSECVHLPGTMEKSSPLFSDSGSGVQPPATSERNSKTTPHLSASTTTSSKRTLNDQSTDEPATKKQQRQDNRCSPEFCSHSRKGEAKAHCNCICVSI